MGIAGLVCGILAVVFIFIPGLGLIGPIIGIIGIVLSAVGRKKAIDNGLDTGLATAGLVLSIIGTVLSIIGYMACIACVGGIVGTYNGL